MPALFDIKEHVIDAAHIREYPHATAHSQEEILKLAVKEYTPRDNPNPQPGDVTIIGAHANGFPKELYEALWEDLHAASKAQGFKIRSIFIMDIAWQGASGIMNEDKLGNDPSWLDYSRDVTQIINHFRPPRPIVGVGHSFGACALVNVSLVHPRLFSTLVLLDPVISRYASTPPHSPHPSPAAMSLYRRDLWPSRAAAAQSFKQSPFYAAWDPRVLSAWCEFGLRETPTQLYPSEADKGKATLRTTKHHEVFTFLRPSWESFDAEGKTIVDKSKIPDIDSVPDPAFPQWPTYRAEGPGTLFKLPHLRPSVMYIFGETSNVSAPVLQEEKMNLTGTGTGGSGGAKAGKVVDVLLKDRGHLFPMEVPEVCAQHASGWIAKELQAWQREEEEFRAWAKRSTEEKTTLGDAWRKYLPKPGRPPKKESKM